MQRCSEQVSSGTKRKLLELIHCAETQGRLTECSAVLVQPSRLPGPSGMLARPCTAPSEVLACSAPADTGVLCRLAGTFPLHLLAFPRCSPLGYTVLPLVVEGSWAESRQHHWAVLVCSGGTCHCTAQGHRSVGELHPPCPTPPPGPLHRPVYHCALPSEAGPPSLQHSPLSVLTCSNPHLHPPPFFLPQPGFLPMDGTGGHC